MNYEKQLIKELLEIYKRDPELTGETVAEIAAHLEYLAEIEQLLQE